MRKKLATAVSLINKARRSVAQQDYSEALRLLNEALEIREQAFGEGDIETASTHIEIGSVYLKKGDTKQALYHYQKALQIRIDKLGESHLKTAAAYGNLAAAYAAEGAYYLALTYYQKELEVQKRALEGYESVQMAETYLAIGKMYTAQGDWERALENSKKALNIFVEQGAENTCTAAAYCAVGDNYIASKSSGSAQSAKDCYKKALDIYIQVLGEKHQDTARAAAAYCAASCVCITRVKSAYDLVFKEDLNTCIRVLGEEHPAIAGMYANIGSVYINSGSFTLGLKYSEKALDIFKRSGEAHPEITRLHIQIGEILDFCERFPEALEHYQAALELSSRAGDHDRALKCSRKIKRLQDYISRR